MYFNSKGGDYRLQQRKIHIHLECMNTIKGIQQWFWRKDPKTGLYLDEPVNYLDNAMAALRYAVGPLRRLEMCIVIGRQQASDLI